MSGFTLNIRTDSAAFTTVSNDEHNGKHTPHYEVARLLQEIAYKVEGYHDRGKILDVNGTTVGEFTFITDEEEG